MNDMVVKLLTYGAAVPVSFAAVYFPVTAAAGAVPTTSAPAYQHSAYALGILGHDDEGHVDFGYDAAFLPAATSGTAATMVHMVYPSEV